MTQEQRVAIGKTWMALGKLLGKDLSSDALSLLLNAVADLDPQKVILCLQNWVNKTNPKFPMPGDVRLELDPASGASPRDVANELCRKIQKCIAKRGFAWSQGIDHPDGTYYVADSESFWTFGEAVTAVLGELGWTVIQDRGGWRSVVEASNAMEEHMFIAQLRDQIESTYRLQKQGVDVTRLALGKSQQDKQQIPQRVLKLLEPRKEDE